MEWGGSMKTACVDWIGCLSLRVSSHRIALFHSISACLSTFGQPYTYNNLFVFLPSDLLGICRPVCLVSTCLKNAVCLRCADQQINIQKNCCARMPTQFGSRPNQTNQPHYVDTISRIMHISTASNIHHCIECAVCQLSLHT